MTRRMRSTSFSGAVLRLVSGNREAAAEFQRSGGQGRDEGALTTLVQVFEASLRLLSPFMPFLTEEIWHAVYDGNPPAKSIALTRFPQARHMQ